MQGNFLGTDNTGLQGFYYVMNKEKFFQGMSNIEAGKYAVLGAKHTVVLFSILGKYTSPS